ncbi:hypothetical protein H5410_040523 [Solanum commersonii]|uniref:Uncharacterized protein n=1 Tax=Solanum commersonii TaxID=4109 RepID=A0A9J5XP64_SOLCO|nr:hypothetical protein H5410_040523 [Solanum commersonii]
MGQKATGAQAEIEISMAQVSRNTFQSNGGSSNPSSSWGMKTIYLSGKKDGETKLDKEYLPLSGKDSETENPRATDELRVSVVGDNP